MRRGLAFAIAGGVVLLALAGCGRSYLMQGERAAWRHDAEETCLKSGAVAVGTVAGWIDVALLRRTWGLGGRAQVANGVTWDAARGRLLVTGKLWPRLFEIAPPEHRGRSGDRRATVE